MEAVCSEFVEGCHVAVEKHFGNVSCS